MCYTLPGPRCSNHASQTLTKAKEALENSEAKIADLKYQTQFMSEYAKDYPDDKKIVAKSERIAKEFDKAKTNHKALTVKLNEAQKAYDTTPAGQKELRDSINQEKRKPITQRNMKNIVELRRREKTGHSKRTWSMLAYKRSQDAKKGITVRQQRGSFITFADRNGSNQEIVNEEELVNS